MQEIKEELSRHFYTAMRIDLEVKIMKLGHSLIALGIVVCIVAPVAAHHSTLAQSTADRVTVRGTITKVEWVNPHVWLYLDVRDPSSGNIVKWGIETNSVAVLKTKGVTLDKFKIGSVITVQGVERTGHSPRMMEVPEPDPSWKN